MRMKNRQCYFAWRQSLIAIRRAAGDTRQHHPCSRCLSSSSSSLGSVLVLSNLYPQPSASAAGVRTNYMLQQFCRDDDWTSIHYATGAGVDKNENSEAVENLIKEGVIFHSVSPNQSLPMKQLLGSIHDLSLVLFDRFYAEEAYSFHLHHHCPEAVRVVDMQDFHSLRQGRQAIVKGQADESSWWQCIAEAKQHVPSHQDSVLMRELASVYRSDLALVCSPYEYDLLSNFYEVPTSKLCMAPFWVQAPQQQYRFDEKQDFVFVGGFRHPPNVDAIQQLAKHVWPRIRKRLPGVQLHVYGAYCPPPVRALHNPSIGFLVHGFVDSLNEALSAKRVMLAPLRYGAGIKGKIIDAWMFGVPVVTTTIGGEGIKLATIDNEKEWGGIVAETPDDFVNGAICLYTEDKTWAKATQNAFIMLSEQFAESHFKDVSAELKDAVRNREARRSRDFFRSLLWHQTARSTEYFSRWIECKENKKS